MKVAVTGARGFLGRRVCDFLFSFGHDVTGIDVASTGICPYLLLPRDITKPMRPLEHIDAVIHLAALANPRTCDANPTNAFDVNVNGTSQVLQMALASGAKKVIFSSSAHVYGISPRYQPTNESHPLYLQNTYTTTKILGEQLCQLYFENYGLSYTTLRLYNAYGPDQAAGYFIPDQILKAKQGRIDLLGGNVTKDWVYVEDVADAFVKALTSNFVGPINIGTGIETSLSTVAGIIAKETKAELVVTDIANPTRMCADRDRASRVLGWSPKIGLDSGLFTLLGSPMRTVAEVA